jgi:hypothetical protein
MGKHFFVGKEKIGIHLSYLYNNRNDSSLNGIAEGISYLPSILPDLKLIVEHDSKKMRLVEPICFSTICMRK